MYRVQPAAEEQNNQANSEIQHSNDINENEDKKKEDEFKVEITWEHSEPCNEQLTDIKSYLKHHNTKFNYWREEKAYLKTCIRKIKDNLVKKNKVISDLKAEKLEIEEMIATLKQSVRDIDAEIL